MILNRRFFIVELRLKDALKRVATQIEMKSLAAILRIQTKLERDDSEAVRIVAIFRDALLSRVAEFRRSLPQMTDAGASFNEGPDVVEPRQTVKAESNQMFEGGTETGGTKEQ